MITLTRALELLIVKLYIPEVDVGIAVVPPSVVAAAVVIPEGVPCNINSSIDVSFSINKNTGDGN